MPTPPPRPGIDVSASLGRSSEETLGSGAVPDTGTAGVGDDDVDISKRGRGPRWPRFGWISAIADVFR